MDGIVGDFYGKILNGDHATINAIELDRRALEDPPFIINDPVFASTADDLLRATIDYEYVDSVKSVNTPVIFQVALVENDIAGKRNVLRKLLKESEGFTVNRTWTKSEVQTVDIDYTLDVPVVNPDNLYLVAFVQDKNTKRILQASIFKAPHKVGTPPVGIEDDPSVAEIRNIHVFPNPASQKVNFQLENQLSGHYQWHIIDQRGVTVKEGKLNSDLTVPQQVFVQDLAGGIYFVRFSKDDRTVVYRKIAILNSH